MSRMKSFAVAAITMLALDLIWLGVISPPLYQAHIGPLLRPQPDLVAAVLFYALYLIGVDVLVVHALPGASVAQVT